MFFVRLQSTLPYCLFIYLPIETHALLLAFALNYRCIVPPYPAMLRDLKANALSCLNILEVFKKMISSDNKEIFQNNSELKEYML